MLDTVIKIEESQHKGIKEGSEMLAAKSYNDHSIL
jgi:hypothetical protein